MTCRLRLGAADIRPEPAPTVNRTLETTVNQPTETNRAADRLVADARRAVHEALVYLPAPEADRVCSLLADLETAVEGRTAMRFAAPAVVSAPVPPTGQTAPRIRVHVGGGAAGGERGGLRDRIRRVLCDHDGKDYLWGTDLLEPDEYGELADALLAVLPASADRAAVLDEAAEAVAELIADGEHDPDCLVAELRRMAAEARGAQQDEVARPD